MANENGKTEVAKKAPKGKAPKVIAIEEGTRVEFDPTGKGEEHIAGTVIATSSRKTKVKGDDGNEYTVANGALTAISKATKKALRAAKGEDGEEKETKSITAGADLSHYVKNTEVKTPGGRPSFDINDSVATMLRGKSFPDMVALTAKSLKKLLGGEAPSAQELTEKYGKLNPGQQRMNLGNRLRGAFRNAEAGEAKAAAKTE